MKRSLCLVLALTMLLLCGCSAKKGAYTPTGDALMPEDYYGEYKAAMEKVFGDGKCRKVKLLMSMKMTIM